MQCEFCEFFPSLWWRAERETGQFCIFQRENFKWTKLHKGSGCPILENLTINIKGEGVYLQTVLITHFQPGTKHGLFLTKWTAPFKTHTPPVEDFGKVNLSGSVNFYMHLPSVWFVDLALSKRSKYLIYKCQMSLSTKNSHSPCWRCSLNLPQGVCGIQMVQPNMSHIYTYSGLKERVS